MSAQQQMMAAGGVFVAAPSQQTYNSIGTFSWTCPPGVTSVSVVCVGSCGGNTSAAGGGGGGALAYANNITVTPGTNYTVVIPGKNSGSPSYFLNTSTVAAGSGSGQIAGVVVAGVGGSGGTGGAGGSYGGGGGGAGGYAGAGGAGGSGNPSLTPGGAGSGGAGGGGSSGQNDQYGGGARGGGGVGINGQSSSGVETGDYGLPGSQGVMAFYGGGASGYGSIWDRQGVDGGQGAVRIIWPGNLRQFPSTRTADE